jgi:hypothetical protein
MASAAKQQRYSFDDFCALIKDSARPCPGFWLLPEWLWQAPRPKMTSVLAKLLAERKK